MGARVIQYLRWLQSAYRRLREDANQSLYLQSWWSKGVSIAPSAIIRLGDNSRLTIEPGCLIGEYTLIDLQNDTRLSPPVTSTLRIGRHTAINEFNNIRAANGEIIIGSDCLISQFVSLIASNHSIARGTAIRDQPSDVSKHTIRIGDDVWIGTHVTVLPGVTIGAGSVIAAGAVVTRDIPEYVIAAGIPAEPIRARL